MDPDASSRGIPYSRAGDYGFGVKLYQTSKTGADRCFEGERRGGCCRVDRRELSEKVPAVLVVASARRFYGTTATVPQGREKSAARRLNPARSPHSVRSSGGAPCEGEPAARRCGLPLADADEEHSAAARLRQPGRSARGAAEGQQPRKSIARQHRLLERFSLAALGSATRRRCRMARVSPSRAQYQVQAVSCSANQTAVDASM